MDACDNCHACVDVCPTKAIDLENRVIDACACLTFKNEHPGDFPDCVPAGGHNSLIGCMKCQDCCPGNTHNKNNVTSGITFTEEETAELLRHKGDEPYSALLTAKIEATGFPEFSQLLPRNLAVLI
jgi:epoxyqueuosine reductase